MRNGVVLALFLASASALLGCVPPKKAVPPPPKPVAVTARPFTNAPSVALVDPMQTGPSYRVALTAEINRDVMPTDDLAIVVSVRDEEVGRYPVVGKFERRPTRIRQEIELPLGDYEIDFVYQGERFAGMPFRLAEVPVWGGQRALQIRMHPGTRISLKQKKLWIGRWWPNDGPPQAWIVEWVRDGQIVTATSGREDRGIPAKANGLVGGAAGAFKNGRLIQNTIWTYGEEYPIPDAVQMTPGRWAARVVHGGASPVAVVFTVLPNGALGELSSRKIAAVGWTESWSKQLEQRALSITEVERLTAKMPVSSSSQPFDEQVQQDGPEAPVRVSTAAVRALFRSKQLAENWYEFLTLNTQAQQAAVVKAAFAKGAKAKESKDRADRAADRSDAEKKTKLRALRAQIETLIKKDGGSWKPEEFPRS